MVWPTAWVWVMAYCMGLDHDFWICWLWLLAGEKPGCGRQRWCISKSAHNFDAKSCAPFGAEASILLNMARAAGAATVFMALS